MAKAKLKCHYDIFYSCKVPCPIGGTPVGPSWEVWTSNTDREQHQIHEKIGAIAYDFNVYSIQVVVSANTVARKGEIVSYTANVYPPGGKIRWNYGTWGTIDKISENSNLLQLRIYDSTHVMAIYDFGGGVYDANTIVTRIK